MSAVKVVGLLSGGDELEAKLVSLVPPSVGHAKRATHH
jgi:hypothetical protein